MSNALVLTAVFGSRRHPNCRVSYDRKPSISGENGRTPHFHVAHSLSLHHAKRGRVHNLRLSILEQICYISISQGSHFTKWKTECDLPQRSKSRLAHQDFAERRSLPI